MEKHSSKETPWRGIVVATFMSLGAALAFAGTSSGCADEVDELVDCTKICSRYEECIDAEYDVTDCIDRCEQQADESRVFEDAADACEACIDDRACAESFPCVDECVGIVP